ncbi:ATP synthase subunit d, mitochondrial [Camponotus floridanus]|uniref:ATP synthase subunit d, mitochondrial n=1 Tax=Camponotus floridanus TaxID=104421 RepID=E2AQG1_CAMFO|nr:ATP synthase subunit d, mitochondrial [Camponotus floridanus]EFN64332.1 ATP synthase subunit d, mitochondrial [Camponotus floridanus]
MSRKAIKAINWAALAERIPETEKNMFATFKAKSDQYLRRMTANPEAPPKIDWVYYKKNIALAGLVDKFQKDYESFAVPYPADKYTSQIEGQEKELHAKIQQFISESNERIDTASKEIERVKGLLPFSEMTMEDFQECYPDDAVNNDKPTAWPHTPEFQPENDPGRPVHH